jgi:hypothetical protein
MNPNSHFISHTTTLPVLIRDNIFHRNVSKAVPERHIPGDVHFHKTILFYTSCHLVEEAKYFGGLETTE